MTSIINKLFDFVKMKSWVESKQIPGQFTGSTGAKLLTPAELSSGYQAWAKKVTILISSHTLTAILFLITYNTKLKYSQL